MSKHAIREDIEEWMGLVGISGKEDLDRLTGCSDRIQLWINANNPTLGQAVDHYKEHVLALQSSQGAASVPAHKT